MYILRLIMLSFQDAQTTEASAANSTSEDLLVHDVIGVDIQSGDISLHRDALELQLAGHLN